MAEQQTGEQTNGNGAGGDGSGAAGSSGEVAGSNNGTNGNSANGSNGNAEHNDGSNDGTDGGGNGSGGGNQGNYGFDGEYDPARARNLIDTLREENKTLAQQNRQLSSDIAELKELIKAAGKGDDGNTGNNGSGSNSDPAMEAVAALRQELAEERLQSRFSQLATSMGMRPEAVEMAFATVRDSINVVNGMPTNLTDIVGNLRASQSFMFATTSQGQQQGGSAGGGTSQSSGADVPTDLERAQMKAGGLTLDQLRELQKGGRPNYTVRS